MASISCLQQPLPLVWTHQRRRYIASLLQRVIVAAISYHCCSPGALSPTTLDVVQRRDPGHHKEKQPNTDGLNCYHLLSLKQPWWPVSFWWWGSDHGAPDIRTSRRCQCICFVSRALIVPTAVLLPGSDVEHGPLKWVFDLRALSKTIHTNRESGSDTARPPWRK